ncbi:DNA-directed DNA polymerase [Tanacetum coccineum]
MIKLPSRLRAWCMTRSSTKGLLSPLENPERVLRSRRKLFDNPSLVELNPPKDDQLSEIKEHIKEEVSEIMAETMEQYMSKTREDYGYGVTRPTINQDTPYELKGQFLKELCDNTFSGSNKKMLRAFPVSLTRAASRWLRNQPSGSITTWEEPDESLFRAWERFKELLMKCPQHYLTDMQEVILFYNGLDVPTRQILDSKGAIPSKTTAAAKTAIQEMAEYSQKWHNETSSRTRSIETFDGLAAIQAQHNNLGREIKKVNEKVYTAQVGCDLCKGPYYTKDCLQKEEGKTLEEAYYTQFGAPYQPGGQYRAAGPGFYQCNNGNSSYPARRETMEESLAKFMAELAKRHEENSNIIKEIRASTDASIRNQGASIKTLELQIRQMTDFSEIHRMEHGPYVVSGSQHRFMFPETGPFPRRLHNYCCDGLNEAHGANILDAYDDILPQKEKRSRANVSVMSFSTYTNLGLGDLSHTRMTIELADRTIKQPKCIAANVLVRIGKFVFLINFVILDIPEDNDVPLILGQPFLSTAHVKIDVYKRKVTLRVGEQKLVFKSVKPASRIIKRVFIDE